MPSRNAIWKYLAEIGQSLREKCPRNYFRSVFSCTRAEYGCGKIRTRRNSLFGHLTQLQLFDKACADAKYSINFSRVNTFVKVVPSEVGRCWKKIDESTNGSADVYLALDSNSCNITTIDFCIHQTNSWSSMSLTSILFSEHMCKLPLYRKALSWRYMLIYYQWEQKPLFAVLLR